MCTRARGIVVHYDEQNQCQNEIRQGRMKSLRDEVLHRRGSIAKGDGVVVICRGDSRIAREMFTFSEREITQRGCA